MGAEVGRPAPDFELRDQHNQPVRMSDFRGKRKVAVWFYPLAFTSVAERELTALREGLGAFHNDDAALLAISCDAPPTHKRQAELGGYPFPLLSDFWPHGEAAQAYGVLDERHGVALPATFLVDRDGVVRHRTVTGVAQARDVAGLAEAMAALA